LRWRFAGSDDRRNEVVAMSIHPSAAKPASPDRLVDVDRLRGEFYDRTPDIVDRSQRVAFGTSGHRGTSLAGTFNEAHVLAITQAICEYRRRAGTSGPLFIGRDTHALSQPAFETSLEVLAANGVDVLIDPADYTPTPVVSHAILTYNRSRTTGRADGIVITPSHNPPEDGGFKYNPSHGGPADTDVTRWIEDASNRLLSSGLENVPRIAYERARRAPTTRTHDYVGAYVADLDTVVDMDAIRRAGLKNGVDPLGGASVGYWRPIAERFGIDVIIVNGAVDPTFRFMPLDWDGQIRMDCSSPYAMATLVGLRDRFDVAFGNDPDADRHGIVTRTGGLMNPNHYLAAAISHLFTRRPAWPSHEAIGKTIVSSTIIDRVADKLQRRLVEVPVGFKWFVPGLLDGSPGFGGEESAGASFLRRDGTVWSTDKDGIIMDLLAVELTAVTGRNPHEIYEALTNELGAPVYERVDAPATPEEKAVLLRLWRRTSRYLNLPAIPIEALATTAPGNGAAIGGIKATTAYGWFAARPSGTENVYKLYAESFRGQDHLRRIQEDAQALVRRALTTVGS
jgi:phosphoglucomutase